MTKTLKLLFAAGMTSIALMAAVPSQADDMMSPEAVYADIEKTFGAVPSFVKAIPKAALPGVWQLTKQLELSEKTALPPKTKALISLAVAAQIPCEYCIYADTLAAKRAGASDEEIAEAVAMAGLTRNMSTIFNGLQVDLTQFKKEMGGS